MEVRKRAGELGELAAWTRAKADENRRIRARLQAVPSRVRARCPDLTAAQVAAVDRELRDALAELAEDDGGVAGPSPA
jgi:terminase small subunit / prophage DNA-packing protein